MPATLRQTYSADDGAKRGPLTMSRVAFHPTDRRLLAATADRRLALWDLDVPPRKERNTSAVPGRLVCAHDAGWVRGFAVSPDGRFVYTGGSDRQLKRWPWAGGQPADVADRDAEAHAGWVEAVAVSPDGRHVVTAGADGLVKVWDAELKRLRTLTGHTDFVRDAAWAPDGRTFVTGAEDGRLLVWDGRTFERLREIVFGDANEQFGQNPALSGVHRLAISRDSRWVAAAGGKKLDVFDLAAGAAVATDKSDTQAAFSPAADVLAAGSNTTRVVAYEAARFQPARPDRNGRIGVPAALPGRELAALKVGDFSLGLAFAADGRALACGKANGTVEVWEVS